MKISKYLPNFIVSLYHYVLALIGAIIFSFPPRKTKVVGVTGTNGKTTTVLMIKSILREAGFKVSSLSSAEIDINGKIEKNITRMSMPGRFFIQSFLHKSRNCDYVILEVTSQGAEQWRHMFINWYAAVFTNLSPEHIEAHKGFNNYRKAKGKFFRSANNLHIVNADDDNAWYFSSFKSKKLVTYSINKNSDYQAKNIVGNSFNVKGAEINLQLLGQFNIYNALAAIAFALEEGIEKEICKKALENIQVVEGRMEKIKENVVIDYAVTPDALEALYKSFPNKNIIAVFGACGGGRDKWKRPELGKIADKYCSKIILTNEDPYDEDPKKILDNISEGIEDKSKVEKIIDRKDAIYRALSAAGKEDIIIVSGKGSESSICIGNKKIPYSDKETILSYKS